MQAQSVIESKSFESVMARSSNSASDAVGINTHLNFISTLYYSHYKDIIKPKLVELDAKHIRDHLGDSIARSRYIELAHQYGIKLLLINNDDGTDLVEIKDEVRRLNDLNPSKPVVDLIEPANERDVAWKKDWVKLGSYMKDYHKVFKSEPLTAAIPLLSPSFADTKNSAIDFGNAYKGVSANMNMVNLRA